MLAAHLPQSPLAAPPPSASGLVHPPGEASSIAKIATVLLQVAERMRQGGLTAADATRRHADTYSTPSVRVDHQGRMQTTILVTAVEPHLEATLTALHVYIERITPQQHSVQAWIPFDRLEAVAALPFVQFLRPPHYARTR